MMIHPQCWPLGPHQQNPTLDVEQSGYDIYIGCMFYGCILYADDIIIILCSCPVHRPTANG